MTALIVSAHFSVPAVVAVIGERTSNPMERAVQQEIKRRTQKVRVFPNEASLIRLVSAVLVEIDDNWVAETKAYIKWECQDA